MNERTTNDKNALIACRAIIKAFDSTDQAAISNAVKQCQAVVDYDDRMQATDERLATGQRVYVQPITGMRQTYYGPDFDLCDE